VPVFAIFVLTMAGARFIDSEADLDAAIKALLPLAQVPEIAYPLLVSSGQLEVLVGLLSHENADIALDVIELIHELTDEDVGEETDNEDEEDPEQREAALKSLINALVRLLLIKVEQLRLRVLSWTSPFWSCSSIT
jgi:beta-catenin-like protein 1